MAVLTFLDLDDTIFQTRRKCPQEGALEVGAVSRDGAPRSYMTRSQRALVDWLLRTSIVIPTTGRSLEALRRVKLPFAHGAILSHGGTVVGAEWQPDQAWHAHVDAILARTGDALARARDTLVAGSSRDGLDLRVAMVRDFDRDIYLVAKHPDADPDALRRARGICEDLVRDAPALRLVPNDNNLALIPCGISKQSAVRHVLGRRTDGGDRVTVGVGDSLSDLGFMLDCHYALVPSHSQICDEALRRHA